MKRRTFLGTLAAAITVPHWPGRADADPAVVGEWSAPFPLLHLARHGTLLPPTDLVHMIFARGSGPGSFSWTWDAVTGVQVQRDIPVWHDAMCGGNVLDEDGRAVYYGGLSGAERTARFDPTTLTWSAGPLMNRKRYYPSAVRSGHPRRVYVFMGRDVAGTSDYYDPEDYTLTKMTPLPASAIIPDDRVQQYPRIMSRLPDGRFFMGGTQRALRTFDQTTATWTTIGNMVNPGQRYDGAIAPLPGTGLKFLMYGGGANRTAEIIDLADAVPVSRGIAPMTYQRGYVNTVLLPDGMVCAVGGRGAPTPYAVELFDPVTETWTVGAAQQRRRDYHSVAVLLRDGRILSAGDPGVGVTQSLLNSHNGELYTPPYLCRGPRPSLAGPLQEVRLGGVARFTATTGLTRVTMIRPGPGTHGINLEQQFYELAFTQQGTALSATMPSNIHLAPPGYYMLFGLKAGIPSVGQYVKLT